MVEDPQQVSYVVHEEPQKVGQAPAPQAVLATADIEVVKALISGASLPPLPGRVYHSVDHGVEGAPLFSQWSVASQKDKTSKSGAITSSSGNSPAPPADHRQTDGKNMDANFEGTAASSTNSKPSNQGTARRSQDGGPDGAGGTLLKSSMGAKREVARSSRDGGVDGTAGRGGISRGSADGSTAASISQSVAAAKGVAVGSGEGAYAVGVVPVNQSGSVSPSGKPPIASKSLGAKAGAGVRSVDKEAEAAAAAAVAAEAASPAHKLGMSATAFETMPAGLVTQLGSNDIRRPIAVAEAFSNNYVAALSILSTQGATTPNSHSQNARSRVSTPRSSRDGYNATGDQPHSLTNGGTDMAKQDLQAASQPSTAQDRIPSTSASPQSSNTTEGVDIPSPTLSSKGSERNISKRRRPSSSRILNAIAASSTPPQDPNLLPSLNIPKPPKVPPDPRPDFYPAPLFPNLEVILPRIPSFARSGETSIGTPSRPPIHPSPMHLPDIYHVPLLNSSSSSSQLSSVGSSPHSPHTMLNRQSSSSRTRFPPSNHISHAGGHEPSRLNIRIHVVTFNMGNVPIGTVPPSLLALERGAAEVYVIGTQESCPPAAWEKALRQQLPSSSYKRLAGVTLGAIHLVVFVKAELAPYLTCVGTSSVATGVANVLGNKGGVAVKLCAGNLRVLFINSHLAAHEGKKQERHANVERITNSLFREQSFDGYFEEKPRLSLLSRLSAGVTVPRMRSSTTQPSRSRFSATNPDVPITGTSLMESGATATSTSSNVLSVYITPSQLPASPFSKFSESTSGKVDESFSSTAAPQLSTGSLDGVSTLEIGRASSNREKSLRGVPSTVLNFSTAGESVSKEFVELSRHLPENPRAPTVPPQLAGGLAESLQKWTPSTQLHTSCLSSEPGLQRQVSEGESLASSNFATLNIQPHDPGNCFTHKNPAHTTHVTFQTPEPSGPGSRRESTFEQLESVPSDLRKPSGSSMFKGALQAQSSAPQSFKPGLVQEPSVDLILHTPSVPLPARSLAAVSLPTSWSNSTGRSPSVPHMRERQTIVAEADLVIWLGDLNYRVNMSRRVCSNLLDSNMTEVLVNNDELLRSMRQQEVLPDFSEQPIHFAPTFKLKPGTSTYSERRTPSYTDRVLYRARTDPYMAILTPQYYNAAFDVNSSDHKPVTAGFDLSVNPARLNIKGASAGDQSCKIM